jgi:poly(3-hydroxyalkanoate) synthetase
MSEREQFLSAVAEPISSLITWNAPDHRHTRYQLEAWLNEAIEEAFALYEAMGGDAHVQPTAEEVGEPSREKAV